MRALRTAFRRAREIPLIRVAIHALDRYWWARLIRGANVVDLEFVSAQLDRPIKTARQAIRCYVDGGFARGLSVNPFFCDQQVSPQLPDSDRVPALYAYLVSDARAIEVSPLWSVREYVAQFETDTSTRESLHSGTSPFVRFWQDVSASGQVTLGDGAARRGVPLAHARDVAIAAARGHVPEPTALSPEVDVVVFVNVGRAEDHPEQALTMASALARRPGFVVNAILHRPLSPATRAEAALLTLVYPHSFSLTEATRAFETGAWLTPTRPALLSVERACGVTANVADVDALLKLSRAHESHVGSLLIGADGVIESAGQIVVSGISREFLSGQPREDAAILGELIDVSTPPTGLWVRHPDGRKAMTSTAVPVARLSGVPLTTHTPQPLLESSRDVDVLLERAGLVLDHATGEYRRSEASLAARAEGRLRWSIKTSAPADERAGSWGDWNFARSLADALSRHGQQVSVDAYPARERASSALDDVTVVLRGPFRISPPSQGLRMLWIFSHPDKITREELEDFDLVYAASVPWAADASARFGLTIHPLLQCTDARAFSPHGLPRDGGVTFVGTARGIARPSVVEPLAAGIDVRVYGPDWRGYIPASAIAATHVPNDELSEVYERAEVVLNDHWPAMRAAGFISNRSFDVVAAGGRVISDEVEGIEEMFGGLVRTYASTEELIAMLTSDVDDLFIAGEAADAVRERIRLDETYDARAEVLLGWALTHEWGSSTGNICDSDAADDQQPRGAGEVDSR